MFETSRLRLRPWRDDDAPGPDEGPDADSLRFMPAGAQPGPDDFPAWLAKRRGDMDAGGDLHWCIADRITDTMLGNVQIFRMGPPEGRFQGELGYWLRPGARGRRIIGEAIEAVAAFAFRPVAEGGLGLVRLHAATDSDNYASQAILRSAGFTQWGADHRAWRRTDGSLSDGLYFELLADEPEPADGGIAGSLASGLAMSQRGSQAGSRAPGFEPVTLEGKGIRLRKWRHTDAERIVEACSDERTRHWLADSLPSPYTLDHAHSYIAGLSEEARNRRGLGWCVADSESDVCLGAITILNLRDALGTAGEIGYWTHPEARGRGIMSEAVRLAVRHAFIPHEDGGLSRIRLRLNAADGNLASQQIARANGFVEVGRDRLAEPLGDGTFADLVRFDLLIAEWNAAAAEDG
ncbi:MAG: GNAT family N-acetyltransferase [Phycicoccus sp.]|nr:GNAT family N-acetyltransferase [Phycicoccus sp.]